MRELLYSSIQRFSCDDGPGIRTTVFLMGCPLRCKWCHNPENLQMVPLLQFQEDLCLYCGACAAACPAGAHAVEPGAVAGGGGRGTASGSHGMRRDRCAGCGACVAACPAGALSLLGTRAEPGELLAEILRDRDFYRASGGGATFSGGEPLLQAQGVAETLRLCRAEGISTAVETAGDVPWDAIRAVFAGTCLFLYDVKCIDADLHRAWTGRGNARILDNARCLARACGRAGKQLVVRTPVVHPFNDDAAEMRRIADFAAGLAASCPGLRCELLPYHSLGYGKYRAIGADWTPCSAPSDAQMSAFAALFEERGLAVRAG